MKQLISIIVPVYNCEKYLDRCICSLINQEYKNIEIILLNDGSTDNSFEICKKYLKADNRIKLINKKNSGVSLTRNSGIDIASGKYLVFVDSDDYVDNDFCGYLYKLISTTNSDIACCAYGFNDQKSDNEECIYSITGDINILKDYFFNDFIKTCVWNKIYKTDLVKKNKFSSTIKTCAEDSLFIVNMLSKIGKITCSNQKKYHYNNLNISLTRSDLKIIKIKDSILSHKIQADIISKYNNVNLNYAILEKAIIQLFTFYFKIDNNTDKKIIELIKSNINIYFNDYRKSRFYKKNNIKLYIKLMLINKFFNGYLYIYKKIKKIDN